MRVAFPNSSDSVDDVRSLAAKKLIACGDIASFKDARDTSVHQKATTSLYYHRVIVYDEDASHVFN
jgi:hypothetical protein